MPNKSPDKTDPSEPYGQKPENLQSAYQIHTLAQMMYGQLYGAQPWATPVGPVSQPWTPSVGAMGMPWAPETHSWPAPVPLTGFQAPMGFQAMSPPPYWPPFYGCSCGCGWRR